MKIRTKSIIDQIELELDKNISEVTENDLQNIKNIIINGVDITGEFQKVYIEDIEQLNSLEYISINNMEIDEIILNVLSKINTLKSIVFNRCELLDFPSVFYTVSEVEFNFCDNFINDILNNFPHITKLTLKGYNIDYIPSNVKILNIQKSNVTNYDLFNRLNLDEIFVSLNEYHNNPDLYNSLNTKVYDKNDCYLLEEGEI